MNRRDLIKLLLSSAIAEAVDVEKLLWTPKSIITVTALPITMYGIPFHVDPNASTGTWLGINRTLIPEFPAKGLFVYASDIQKKFMEEK